MKLKPPKLREVDLSMPVQKWLEKKGYVVKPEVPCYSSNIDLVGVKNEQHTIGVELKLTLSHQVRYQAMRNKSFVDESWVAIGTIPRRSGVADAEEQGLGILCVIKGDVIEWLIADPTKSWPVVETYKRKLIEKHKRLPAGLGGLPSTKGKGPAQLCKQRVIEYRKEHPKATWKEIFQNVPNHYSSYRSMCTSLNQWWGVL